MLNARPEGDVLLESAQVIDVTMMTARRCGAILRVL